VEAFARPNGTATALALDMTKTILAALALIGSTFLVGCTEQPIESEERGSSESNILSREDKEKQLKKASTECPTTEDSVQRSYLIALRRFPDAAGQAYWVGQIDSGNQTRIEVLRNIFRSEEFKTTYADFSDSDFVQRMYVQLMNRTADDGGAGYCLGALANGATRADIAIMLVNSDEFRSPNLDNHGACYFE
jgi:hypothetical protein